MVSSIAIGLGMSTSSGASELHEMRGLYAFALRGVVASALTARSESAESVIDSHHTLREVRPPNLTFPRPFIR
jgi:hypothetical protein